MEDIKNIADIEKIADAINANNGEFFFIPWIGKNFEKGIKDGQKVLVVGASHYCNHTNQCICPIKDKICDYLTDKGCKEGCENFPKCTNGMTKEFNDKCEWMNIGEYKSNFSLLCNEIESKSYIDKERLTEKLESTTLGEVCNFLAGVESRSFKIFTRFFCDFFKIEKDDVWKNIAFVNYAQNFQPKSTGNIFRSTDCTAFEKYIKILDPNVIIVWGKAGEHSGIRKFMKNPELNNYIWKGENVTYLHTYHPSYVRYKDNGKLAEAMEIVFC